MHSFIHSFMHSFIHSCMHSFVRSFIHSFIHSCSVANLYVILGTCIRAECRQCFFEHKNAPQGGRLPMCPWRILETCSWNFRPPGRSKKKKRNGVFQSSCQTFLLVCVHQRWKKNVNAPFNTKTHRHHHHHNHHRHHHHRHYKHGLMNNMNTTVTKALVA